LSLPVLHLLTLLSPDARSLTVSEGLGVGEHLPLIRDELGPLGLVQRARQARDGVVVRPALEPGEHRKVDLVLDVVGDLLALLVDGADAWFLRLVGRRNREEGRGGGKGEVFELLCSKLFSLPLSFSLPLRTRKRTLAEEDHRPAGAAQRLVRRRRDDVGVLERRRDEAGGDEPGDVRHVGQEP